VTRRGRAEAGSDSGGYRTVTSTRRFSWFADLGRRWGRGDSYLPLDVISRMMASTTPFRVRMAATVLARFMKTGRV